MNPNLRTFLITVFVAGLTAAYTAMVYPSLPDQIPVHFNAAGLPDRFESKSSGAWLMLYFILGLGALFAVLPAISPKTKSIENFRSAYDTLTLGMLLFLAGIQAVTLHAASTGKLDPVGFGLLMCALFGFLGNILGKVTPNYFVGIRTPWTLESPENWERTHRLAARLTVGTAVLGALLILLGVNPVIGICLAVLGLLAPVPYSYWLYRNSNNSNQATN